MEFFITSTKEQIAGDFWGSPSAVQEEKELYSINDATSDGQEIATASVSQSWK